MIVVFIHGPTASGKHTIGSILSQKIGLPLFHNHLTVDLVKTLFEFGTLPFVKLREEIWVSSFAEATKANQSFIFTFQPEATVTPDLIDRFVQIIESSSGSIFFVELLCSKTEVLNRLGNDSRGNFGKLQDAHLYEQIDAQGGFDFPALPEALITIDTETLSPEEAASAIEQALSNVV